MTRLTLNQVLLLYSWFPLTALLFFLLLIGRFYQRFSGEKTLFRLFAIPMLLFGVAVVRLASINRLNGDPLGDLLMAAAGALLLVLCVLLYRRMVLKTPRSMS